MRIGNRTGSNIANASRGADQRDGQAFRDVMHREGEGYELAQLTPTFPTCG